VVDTALKNSLATTQSISNTTSTSSDPEIGHGETQATIGGDLSAEVSQQQVLKFVEEEPTIRESATVLPSPLSMDRMLSSAAVDMKQHTIKDFLQRPMILSSFQWTPNARSLLDQILPDNTVDGSNNLYQGIFPQDIIEGGRDSTMVFYEKLSGFQLFRGKLVIRVMVNSQKFQAGRLIIYAFPYPNALENRNAMQQQTATSITQLPRVEIDLGERQTAELELPWVGPFLYYDITQNNVQNWGVYIQPYAPLVSVNGAGQVEVTVIGWYEDVDVKFPTGIAPAVQPASVKSYAEFLKQRRITATRLTAGKAAESAATGSVSGVAASISSVAKPLAMVPGLGEIAGPVAAVADTVGGIAKMFGASKPESKVSTQKSQLWSGSSFLETDGENIAHSMSVLSVNSLDTFSGWAGSEKDEMHYSNIAARPAFIDAFYWNASSLSGAQLWHVKVGPTFWWSKAGDASFVTMPPMSYLAMSHGQWRGSIKYHFKAVKTGFHSGRLRIFFVPSYFSTTEPSEGDIAKTFQTIWDLRDSTSLTVTVPFISYVQSLRTEQYVDVYNGTRNTIHCYSGTLFVQVLNELVYTETVASNIPIIIEASAGADFELQVPTRPQFRQYYLAPPTTGIKLTSGVQLGTDPWTASLDSTSELAMNETVNEVSTTMAETTLGETICSLRALTKRFLFWNNLVVGPVIAASPSFDVQFIQPNGCVDTRQSDGSDFGVLSSTDWLSFTQTLFAFRRGGTNLKIKVNPIGIIHGGLAPIDRTAHTTGFIDVSGFNTTPYEGAYSGSPANSDKDYVTISGPPTIDLIPDVRIPIYNRLEGLASVSIPYYSRSHCLLNEASFKGGNTHFNTQNIDYFLEPQNYYRLSATSYSEEVTNLEVFRAARDDWECGFFIGVPTLAFLHAVGSAPGYHTQATQKQQPDYTRPVVKHSRVTSDPRSDAVKIATLLRPSTENRRYNNATGEALHTIFPTLCASGISGPD
jgi:hypothetical protein